MMIYVGIDSNMRVFQIEREYEVAREGKLV
jgi:hypothetical protein